MDGSNLFALTTPLQTFEVLQNDLFPHAKKLGIKTASYIHIILNHSKVSDEDKEFLKNGVKWLNEEAVKIYKKTYVNLSEDKREVVLKSISKQRWGESWLYDVMSYLFEAMLGDPIYGGNNHEAGWKWLNFQGGELRPKRAFL